MMCMGTYYYLVSPKLETMFVLGKSFGDDTTEMIEKRFELQLNRFEEDEVVETYEWTIGNLKDQKLKDMAKIISFYDDIAWIFSEWKFWTHMLVIVIKKFDKDAHVISEYDEEFDKLRKKKYKEIDY